MRIALAYFLFGAAWILFSDLVVNQLFSPQFIRNWHVQTIKGWFFIALTAVLLYFLIRRTYTAVRASAEARRQTERRTQMLIERVREYAIFTLGDDGKVLTWNRGAQQITQWREDQILGRDFTVFYPGTADSGAQDPPPQASGEQDRDVKDGDAPDRSPQARGAQDRRAQDRRPQDRAERDLNTAREQGWHEEESPRLRKDGTEFWAATQLTALRDESGEPAGFLCVLRDVTERRRQQQALRQANQMLSAVINASPLSIVTIDRDDHVAGWNPAATRLFGWSSDEVLGKPLPTVPAEHQAEHRELLARQLAGERVEGREVVRRTKTGETVQLSLWTAPLNDASGKIIGAMGVFADLTEPKRAEAEVRRLNETLERRVQERTARLEEANEELQAFSYTVSHDLQFPLRSLQQLSRDLLEKAGDTLTDEPRADAMRIIGAAARMQRQIEDLLEYSRVSRSELKTEPISLVLIVHELLGRLERDPAFHAARIVVQEPLGWVLAHRLTLQQVILNLLTNAITFVRPGTRPSVTISATELPAGADGPRVRLCVEDNGIGIDAEGRERIFHLFERLPAAEGYPGLGIGLTVARRGVERMGGSITFEPSPTGGTIFCIDLPKAERAGRH